MAFYYGKLDTYRCLYVTFRALGEIGRTLRKGARAGPMGFRGDYRLTGILEEASERMITSN